MHKALIAAGITRETEFGKARIAATPKAFSIMKQALQLSQAGHPDLARMLIEVHKIERGKGQEEVLGGIVEKLITAGIVDETFLADTEKMKGLKEKIRNAVPDVFEELYKRKETPAGLSLTTDKLNKITQTLIKNNFSQASIDNLTKTLTDANYNVDVNKIVEFAKSKAKTLNLGTE
jgi:ribosomal protein L17